MTSATTSRTLLMFSMVLFLQTGIAVADRPEPSYSDQWKTLEASSSPLLNLRNQGQTDTPDEPEAPEEPEEPEVEDVEVKTDTVSVESPSIEGDTDPLGEEKMESDTADTKKKSKSDTSKNRSVSADTEQEPKKPKSKETEQRTSDEKKQPDPEDVVAEPDQESEKEVNETTNQSERRAERRLSTQSLFETVQPEDTGPILNTVKMIKSELPAGTIPLGMSRTDIEPAQPERIPNESVPFWWKYYWWIAGGLVVSAIIGMFSWVNRRKVEVIERNYSSRGELFQNELKKNSPAEQKRIRTPQQDEASQHSGENQGSGKVELSELNSEHDSSFTPDSYAELAEKLEEAGFDRSYADILELYFDEGFAPEEIAEKTSRKLGEVGLVLDYVERLREGQKHGTRA